MRGVRGCVVIMTLNALSIKPDGGKMTKHIEGDVIDHLLVDLMMVNTLTLLIRHQKEPDSPIC